MCRKNIDTQNILQNTADLAISGVIMRVSTDERQSDIMMKTDRQIDKQTHKYTNTQTDKQTYTQQSNPEIVTL